MVGGGTGVRPGGHPADRIPAPSRSILAAPDRDARAIDALGRTVTINDRYGSETAEDVSDLRSLAGLQQRNGLHHEAQQNLDRARDIEARHSDAAT